MSERWRKLTTQAFRFWRQVLVASDEAPETQGQYRALITHLQRFEKQTREIFRFVVTRGADPVYLLHVLIQLCDEERVKKRVGFPQVRTQEKSGSLANLRDFHFVTESEFNDMEATLATFEKAGHPVDQLLLGFLRQGFEALPEPPVVPGVRLEKAILHTEFTFPNVDAVPGKGRTGEHYFNTAMVLLARHLERPKPRGAWYTSIAQLLNAFCPVTYGPSPLSNPTVRQRILSVEDRVQEYCEAFERCFEASKRLLHHYPIPFNPWTSSPRPARRKHTADFYSMTPPTVSRYKEAGTEP